MSRNFGIQKPATEPEPKSRRYYGVLAAVIVAATGALMTAIAWAVDGVTITIPWFNGPATIPALALVATPVALLFFGTMVMTLFRTPTEKQWALLACSFFLIGTLNGYKNYILSWPSDWLGWLSFGWLLAATFGTWVVLRNYLDRKHRSQRPQPAPPELQQRCGPESDIIGF